MKRIKENDLLKRAKNSKKGITLIALVITIIVLLILAGVTIAMLTGENGILTKANLAKTTTEQAKLDEEEKLKNLEGQIDESLNSQFSEAKGVNKPKLGTGMIPIKYENGNWIVAEENDTSWYNYDETNMLWANIMLSDGTYKQGEVVKGQVIQENELRKYVRMDTKICV